jgi:hypothetical protein
MQYIQKGGGEGDFHPVPWPLLRDSLPSEPLDPLARSSPPAVGHGCTPDADKPECDRVAGAVFAERPT